MDIEDIQQSVTIVFYDERIFDLYQRVMSDIRYGHGDIDNPIPLDVRIHYEEAKELILDIMENDVEFTAFLSDIFKMKEETLIASISEVGFISPNRLFISFL